MSELPPRLRNPTPSQEATYGIILLAVAGANNAGVSTVIETFGVRGDTPSSIARVEERGA